MLFALLTFESRLNKNERRKTKLFLPHYYSSLRAFLGAGTLFKKWGKKNKNAPYGAKGIICLLKLCAYGAVDRVLMIFCYLYSFGAS